MIGHRFFAEPGSSGMVALTGRPVLATWDRSGSPSHMAMTSWLSELSARLSGPLDGPLVLGVHLGLAHVPEPLLHHDVDNYLYPVVKSLDRGLNVRLASVWGFKRRGDITSIAVGDDIEVPPPSAILKLPPTTASVDKPAYKQHVKQRVIEHGATVLPDGAVRLEIAFVVGPPRVWWNLWKPTIDALGPLLGGPDDRWTPRDGRISTLGLHVVVDPALRYEVGLTIAASPDVAFS